MASVFSRILGQPDSEEPTSEQQNEQSAVHKKQLAEMEKRVAALETKVGQLEKQLWLLRLKSKSLRSNHHARQYLSSNRSSPSSRSFIWLHPVLTALSPNIPPPNR